MKIADDCKWVFLQVIYFHDFHIFEQNLKSESKKIKHQGICRDQEIQRPI